jgi:hypothetical protein
MCFAFVQNKNGNNDFVKLIIALVKIQATVPPRIDYHKVAVKNRMGVKANCFRYAINVIL